MIFCWCFLNLRLEKSPAEPFLPAQVNSAMGGGLGVGHCLDGLRCWHFRMFQVIQTSPFGEAKKTKSERTQFSELCSQMCQSWWNHTSMARHGNHWEVEWKHQTATAKSKCVLVIWNICTKMTICMKMTSVGIQAEMLHRFQPLIPGQCAGRLEVLRPNLRPGHTIRIWTGCSKASAKTSH